MQEEESRENIKITTGVLILTAVPLDPTETRSFTEGRTRVSKCAKGGGE